MKVQNLRFCVTPLYRYVEFAGIHSDLFFASEGTASPKLAVRSDDRTSQTGGLSGCRSCSPHSLLRSEKIRFIQPLIQSNSKGTFAVVKEDMGFRQYLYRGMKNALAESVLVAIAYNFNKLHWKIQSQKTGIRLYELNKTA